MNIPSPLDQSTMQRYINLSIEPMLIQPNPSSSQYVLRNYPMQYVNYGTLTYPSTISHYCYYPGNCPIPPAPIYPEQKYKMYEDYQQEKVGLGTVRYAANARRYRNQDMNACPVLNSNMTMPIDKPYVH